MKYMFQNRTKNERCSIAEKSAVNSTHFCKCLKQNYFVMAAIWGYFAAIYINK